MLQWDALQSYFLSEFEDDEDSQDDDKVTMEVCLVKKFKDPFSKLYALFVQSVMPVFDHYNMFLQSEEPLFHLLHESTMKLCRMFLSRFIKPEVITESADILSIDIDNSENHKELSSIHIGFSTKQYALSHDLIGTVKYTKFLKEAKQFFIGSCKYLLKSIPILRDPILKSLSILLKPSQRVRIGEDDIAMLTSCFPLVVPTGKFEQLQRELLDYQTAHNTELPSDKDENQKQKRIDLFWYEMSMLKDSVTGTPHFPNLTNLTRFLLLIPHSNSFCKDVFSSVKKILTDARHNLGKDVKKGHAHSRVYESETGIRNNLVGLLVTEINIFQQQKIACYQWEPSKALMKNAKSISYQNLPARKK